MIGAAALASMAPAGRPPDDMTPDDAVRYQFARLLAGELRKALPQGEGMDALQGLAPVLDDALARSLMDRMPGPTPTAPSRDHRITSGFGHRIDPIHGGRSHHAGVDLAAPEGTPIRSARDGVVLFAGKRGGYGNLLVVDHGDGVTTRYAHCRDLQVRAGDRVGRGQDIGTVGSTGRSTGPHVHVELRRDGKAVAPEPWMSGILPPR